MLSNSFLYALRMNACSCLLQLQIDEADNAGLNLGKGLSHIFLSRLYRNYSAFSKYPKEFLFRLKTESRN